MNWTEKYRPKIIEEVIGQNKFTDDAKNWVAIYEMPNILLYGQPGTGKTSAAYVIAKQMLGEHMSSQFKEINASQDRRLDTIRETVSNFASWKAIDEVPFKIMLMDELDGMTKDSQRALKRTMERAHNVRFIITCNNPHEIDMAIRSRCANYLFMPLSVDTIVDILSIICEKEKLSFNKVELTKFAELLNGDLRRGINELQACSYSGGSLVDKSKEFISQYKDVVKSVSAREYDGALTVLLDEVYRGRNVREISHNLHRIILEEEMENRVKYKWLRLLGEMEWRAKDMTPKIIVSWLIAQLYE